MADSSLHCYKSTVQFPVIQEILEHIFGFLDGQSLCMCELVCIHWNNAISKMSKVWRPLCNREIPHDMLEHLGNVLSPNWTYDSSNNGLDYYGLFHLWFNWAYLLKKNDLIVRSTQHMKLGSNSISCLAVSGETVITGHEHGTVCLWLCLSLPLLKTKQKPSPLDSVLCHRNSVTNIGLIYKSEFPVDQSLKHNFMLSVSDDHAVRLSRLEGMKIISVQIISRNPTTTKQISVFHDQFAILEQHLVISLWHVDADGFARTVIPERFSTWRDGDFEPLTQISMHKEQVFGFSDNFNFFKLDYQQYALRKITSVNNCDKMARRVYLWSGCVAAVISIHYYICISIRDVGEMQYNVSSALSSCPYSLHLYGRTFLVGTDAGAVFVYIINDKADLLRLDFHNYVCKWDLSKHPIIHLETGMSSEGLCIYASSHKHLYCLTYQFEERTLNNMSLSLI